MPTEPKDGVARVQKFLIEKGSQVRVDLLPESTATASDAARALGVSVTHIGKSIVFGSDTETVIALVSGDCHIDTNALRELLVISGLVPLSARDVKRRTGFAVGGVSPFALPSTVRIIIDRGLTQLQDCYVAAGHPQAVALVSLKELLALTNASIADIKTNPLQA